MTADSNSCFDPDPDPGPDPESSGSDKRQPQRQSSTAEINDSSEAGSGVRGRA
jgi:hypothetical protein